MVPDTPKSEIVFSSPHLTRNLRFQKEYDDLVEEEHKTNSSLDSSSPSSSSFLSSNSYPNLPHSSSLLKTHSSPHLSHFFFFSSSSPFPLLYPLHLLPPFPFFVMYYFVLKFLFHCSLYCIEVWCFFFMDLLLVCFFFGCSSSPPSMLPNFFLSFSSSRFTVTKWAIIFFKCVDL